MNTLGIKKRRKKMKYYYQIKKICTLIIGNSILFMRNNFLEGNL